MNERDGFGRVVYIAGLDDLEGLDIEESSGEASGWDTFGGIGLPSRIGSTGYNYSKTNQKGRSETKTGFIDMNGDGLLDIVMSGKDWYYRNTSDEEEQVSFKKETFIKSLEANTEEIREKLRQEEVKAYEELYYKQTPFRAWRAPISGKVIITQGISPSRATISEDGIMARMYKGSSDAAVSEYELKGNQGRWKREGAGSYEMGAGESLYFIGDTGRDTRGDDIEWNVKLKYDSMAYFEGMKRGDIYVPPSGDQKYTLINENDILYPLFIEIVEDGNRFYKVNQNRAWETIIRESIKQKANENNEDYDNNEGIDRQVQKIWETIVERGWYVPGLIKEQEFNELVNIATLKDNNLWNSQSNNQYREALIAYYKFDGGSGYYTVNEEGKYAVGAEWNIMKIK
jgi:hypothetical protein